MSWSIRLTALWAILLAGIAAQALTIDPGSRLIRDTIRLALLYYALAATSLLRARPGDWKSTSALISLARTCWTCACLAFLAHVALALHFYHHWSHTDAVQRTREVSGLGEGIYVSYFFTLLWTADVLAWWLRPGGYATRPVWIDRALHGFMAFIIFNGTVVFESGLMRWAGVVLFAWLGVLLSRRNWRPLSNDKQFV